MRFDPQEYEKAIRTMKNEMTMYESALQIFREDVKEKTGMNISGDGGLRLLQIKIGQDRQISIMDSCYGPATFIDYIYRQCLLNSFRFDITCIDNNEEHITYAESRYRHRSWEFYHADATTIDLYKKFDYILASSAYHHIEDKSKQTYLINLRTHLKDDGKIIMCENFLPNYTAATTKTKQTAINQYYHTLREYYRDTNTPIETIRMIELVWHLELKAEDEHKVNFKRFKKDIKKSGLEIIIDKPIWQPDSFNQSNAGSHVILLKKK